MELAHFIATGAAIGLADVVGGGLRVAVKRYMGADLQN